MAFLPMTAAEAVSAIGMYAMPEAELRSLNSLIVGRMRQLQTVKEASAGNQFRIGQHVTFDSKYGRRITMQVTKINAKTLCGVETHDGGSRTQWRVSPSLCKTTP